MSRRQTVRALVQATLVLLLAGVASAQTAEIAGTVRDTSGAVLPGVTVEAASPALIEKSRTVVTDGQGQYRVIDLRPGTYSVTFGLEGFNAVRREGIVLTAAFSAAVNAELAVGSLEETITVSGASPLVDVQTVSQRRALTSQMIDDLPTGRTFQNLSVLVPGVSVPLGQQDVGGSDGARWQTLSVHGSRDDQMPLLLNGMPFNNMNNTGGGYNTTITVNSGTVEEMTVTTSGLTAEARSSGVMANTVPKEGSNALRYYLFGNYTNDKFQSENLSDDLKSRGLTAVSRVNRIWDINPTVGGPIIRNRLWFYGGFRHMGASQYLANTFINRTPAAPVYCNRPGGCLYRGSLVPDSRDISRQATGGDVDGNRGQTLNLTWQIAQKHKANFFGHANQRRLDNNASPVLSPEAITYLQSMPDYILQTQWSSPMTNKLLLEGGMMFFNEMWYFKPLDSNINGYGPTAAISKVENSSGVRYGAPLTHSGNYNHAWNMRAAVNYVTGSHAFKFGITNMWGTRNYRTDTNQAQAWTLLNGEPQSITQYARPLSDLEKLRSAFGAYLQDRWTIRTVTLNVGLRFDYHNAYVPAQDVPALLFVAARSYPAVENAPNWKDLSPRLGAAWDVRGDGRTVLRANYGRYVASESTATATANNPLNTSINQASRRWTDSDLDYVPDCDLTSRGATGECGALSQPLGALNIVTTWDPRVTSGFGVRPNDAEVLVGVQQQLRSRLMLDVQYTHHWFGNFWATQNQTLPASAYDSYCVTAPSNSQLPDGGGSQICGFADVKPQFFGIAPKNLVTKASDFGKVSEYYKGLDATMTARLDKGGMVSGGLSAGKQMTDSCELIDKANIGSNSNSTAGAFGSAGLATYPSKLYCRTETPFIPDFKFLVSYPLPWWGLSVSATMQNRQGPQLLASYAVNSALTTLGRPLSLGTATVHLIPIGERYGDRVNQLDVRFGKSVPIGRGSVRLSLDVFNALNSSAILAWNTRYGSSWLAPTQILQGRLVKFGAQLTF